MENWKFTIRDNEIKFDIERTVTKSLFVEQVSFPTFLFNDINTWEGAYQGYGGLAWFYLFNEKLATYGVHTNTSKFWNSKTGIGLQISVAAPGQQVAMKYSRSNDDKLLYGISISGKEMIPRFDSGTNRKRFIRKRTDVWAPFNLHAGKTSQSITLSYFDFNQEYDRGRFAGINGQQVSSVLNTIARIGVIDKKHFGGNSWHTPYGPICLHEQYIAQMGLAINDETYLKGYQDCLDFYRENAFKPDGRVWPRWAYNKVDIMQGQVTDKGFYEAQWGFLLDSNPDIVTNVAELYDLTGNKVWVKTHQKSCEKALDWIIKRDSDNDGLVEMMTDGHAEKKGSDWIDIIWAAYENAFVNAKLYFALIKWIDIERQLGNITKANFYGNFAAKLKNSFNKSTEEGGFWDENKNCYIHWRDKDNSIHGNNLVTPVNFMAIAYGICDDRTRRNHILDEIEYQMQKEKLFFWPLCLYSYNPGEGNDWQFPFPAYENGDIFLSWGALAVKAYADYKPELALKYVRNVMNQYSIDGLAYQRYGRAKQNGLGDDILSGNSLSVIGLYQAIYGINPLYNRFYLNPHITSELGGTELNYNFRGQKLKIGLDVDRYSVASNRFKIISNKDFGFYDAGNELFYFHGNNAIRTFKVKAESNNYVTLDINKWSTDEIMWLQSSADNRPNNLVYTINSLKPNAFYIISVNGKNIYLLKADASGTLVFNYNTSTTIDKIIITKR
ncbi:MAG TPA: hypothetical protein VMY77_14125 [Chitinophagaceae bacterium]|nr:hypothetical protein [Chitinophagaceae bacterium]